MIKSLFISISFIVLLTSCNVNNSSGTIHEDGSFELMMYGFYNAHLRYPRSTNDYCRMFYLHDSINDFKFARWHSDSTTIRFESYDDYNRYLDSVYTSHSDDHLGMVPYFTWQLFYKNRSEDDMEYKNGKLFFYNKDDGCTYCVNSYVPIVHDWLIKRRTLDAIYEFSTEEQKLMDDYLCVKLCTKDSLVIDFPDSVFNKYECYNKLSDIVDSATINVQEFNSNDSIICYSIRYNCNGKIESAEKENILPKEISNNQQLIQYMDSCVHIDKRIGFLQFVFVKYK